jgi:hypothetical protein
MKSLTARFMSGAALLVSATLLTLAGATNAQAVTGAEVVKAVQYAQEAYGLYQKFFGNQLTLEQAEAQIISVINEAKTEIIAEIDRVAADEVKACAKDAVTAFVDIRRMSPDTAMAFAMSTLSCVDKADVGIDGLPTPAAVDQVGFALNAVGPIALMARAHAGFSTDGLRQTVIHAHQRNIQRLQPSCIANPLTGDSEPGQPLEIQIICTAYNGDQGFDSGFGTQPIDYTYAIQQATSHTSYPVSQAALSAVT